MDEREKLQLQLVQQQEEFQNQLAAQQQLWQQQQQQWQEQMLAGMWQQMQPQYQPQQNMTFPQSQQPAQSFVPLDQSVLQQSQQQQPTSSVSSELQQQSGSYSMQQQDAQPATPPLPPDEEEESVKSPEPVDLVEKVVHGTSYEERIEMVGEILERELPTLKKKTANFALSVVTNKEGKEVKRLPASLNFGDKFGEIMMEASAAEGSHRQKNPKNRFPLDIGHYPNRPKVKMEYYEISERPWRLIPVGPPKGLFTKNLYCLEKEVKNYPDVYLKQEKVKDWEEMARENVTILSHTDHFLAAASTLFQDMFDRINRGEKMPQDVVFDMAGQGICMLYSAGMALQDLTRNNVWLAGEALLARRDSYLRRLKDKIPPHTLQNLRFGDPNLPFLFDPEMVQQER